MYFIQFYTFLYTCDTFVFCFLFFIFEFLLYIYIITFEHGKKMNQNESNECIINESMNNFFMEYNQIVSNILYFNSNYFSKYRGFELKGKKLVVEPYQYRYVQFFIAFFSLSPYCIVLFYFIFLLFAFFVSNVQG